MCESRRPDPRWNVSRAREVRALRQLRDARSLRPPLRFLSGGSVVIQKRIEERAYQTAGRTSALGGFVADLKPHTLTEDDLPSQHPGPLAPHHPGPRPPWWRFNARQRWQRRAERYLRSYRHHEAFLHCIEQRIPMPKVRNDSGY